jgi:hypothetical protein
MVSTNMTLRTMVQSCKVVRLPKFLCRDSIAAVLNVQQAYRVEYGYPGPCRPGVVTTYLSTDDLFRRTEPALFEQLRSLRLRVDSEFVRGSEALLVGQPERWRGLESLSLRCIELHTTAPGGHLASTTHCDHGSTVTVDVLLDDEFTGGEFETLSCTASSSHTAVVDPNAAPRAAPIRFELGDAIIFPSYKYHSVRAVTTGCRKTLVLEFWAGDERHCDHRCPLPTGLCDHTARRDDMPMCALADGLFD